jgi:deoxycytidylate deaminase
MEKIEIINRGLRQSMNNSLCTKRPIGAFLVLKDGKTFIDGWNGPPDGFEDYCTECPRKNSKSGTDMDKCPSVHAEIAPILYAAKYGYATEGSTLFISCGLPCKDCMKELIEAGVRRIVSPYPLEDSLNSIRGDGFVSGDTYNFPLSEEMMRAAGIEYIYEPQLVRHKQR